MRLGVVYKMFPNLDQYLGRPLSVMAAGSGAACSPCKLNTRIDDGDTAKIEAHGQDGYVVVGEADPKEMTEETD